jgi:hypothetical protein
MKPDRTASAPPTAPPIQYGLVRILGSLFGASPVGFGLDRDVIMVGPELTFAIDLAAVGLRPGRYAVLQWTARPDGGGTLTHDWGLLIVRRQLGPTAPVRWVLRRRDGRLVIATGRDGRAVYLRG